MHSDWRDDLKEPHQRLQWARKDAGFSGPTEAAEAMGLSQPSTYLGHENGSRGLARAGQRYANFYRIDLGWLLTGKGTPRPGMTPTGRGAVSGKGGAASRQRPQPEEIKIIGRAGAGHEGSIKFEQESDLGMAPMPPGANESTVALEVWGNSMRPIALDGWLVYYDDRRGGLTADMLGQPCVIGLASGHTVIKTPHPGSKRGVYNLESANPAVDTMRDQRVKWAALVTAIIPRRSARNLAKHVRGEASV